MSPFIAINHSLCTGCRTCEVVCSLYHFGECNPEKSAIRIVRRERGGLVFALPLVCQQCHQASCLEACPTEAIRRENEEASLMFDQEKCTGCGMCTEACPAGCISLDQQTHRLISCDLCQGRPQCISLCHSNCLTLENFDDTGNLKRVKRLVGLLEAEGLMDSVPGKGGQ
jgi:anaerobic carbon-monoxide dehydrogenase iron sulfur subunit